VKLLSNYSIVFERLTHTDGRIDGQTDGRTDDLLWHHRDRRIITRENAQAGGDWYTLAAVLKI